MKLSIKHANFSKKDERQNFVEMLSATIEGRLHGRFKPYCPNAPYTLFWVLDSGNNWWITFDENNENAFEIKYRYQCDDVKAEEALAAWLAYRVKSYVFENSVEDI